MVKITIFLIFKKLQKAVHIPFYLFQYIVEILLSSMLFTNMQLIVMMLLKNIL